MYQSAAAGTQPSTVDTYLLNIHLFVYRSPSKLVIAIKAFVFLPPSISMISKIEGAATQDTIILKFTSAEDQQKLNCRTRRLPSYSLSDLW